MNDKRKPAISYIEDDQPDNILCPFCIKVGINVKLVPHYYDIHEREIIDPDNFLQCPKNGNHLIPIYEAKLESEYGPIVDLIDNPFDSGSEFKGVEKRSNKKKPRRPKDKLNKDDVFSKDMAAEKGDINILYDSSGNY